jgi:hypothetical protein
MRQIIAIGGSDYFKLIVAPNSGMQGKVVDPFYRRVKHTGCCSMHRIITRSPSELSFLQSIVKHVASKSHREEVKEAVVVQSPSELPQMNPETQSEAFC